MLVVMIACSILPHQPKCDDVFKVGFVCKGGAMCVFFYEHTVCVHKYMFVGFHESDAGASTTTVLRFEIRNASFFFLKKKELHCMHALHKPTE